MHKTLELHPMLIKQLNKLGLSAQKIAADDKNWQEFLEKVSRYYYDAEQERYLLERSLEISSREMRELNDKLSEAQTLAHLGYWHYNRSQNKTLWSPIIYELFGIDPNNEAPPFDVAMDAVNEKDRPQLNKLINRAFNEGKEYEMEFRIKNSLTNKTHWLYVAGKPNIVNNNIIESLSGIAIDITQKKEAEFAMKNLHQQLLTAARQAGMSEVATSVLHNIGNSITSVNISISLIKEILEKIGCQHLVEASHMIKENIQNPTYLIDDKKGKLLPDYLASFAKSLASSHEEINNEIKRLNANISHIKDIVILQKDLSGISGILEMIPLPEIVNTALSMCFADTSQNEITVHKHYHFSQAILVDKTKLLQVLVNIIRNAKDALAAAKTGNKLIDITIDKSTASNEVNIVIKDNGYGIANDKMIQIFSFGYTTKKDGHGFGLHSSAIAVNEMGGKIKANSDGPGKGAAFIITLPLSTSKNAQEGAHE